MRKLLMAVISISIISHLMAAELTYEDLEQSLKEGGFIFASWNAHTPGREGQCHCPDGQDYTPDPYTGRSIQRDCAKEYGCREDIVEPRAQIFRDKEDHASFAKACPQGACTDWLVRDATEEEVLNGFASAMGWKIEGDKYNPGPDAWKVKGPVPNNWEGKLIGAGPNGKEAIRGAFLMAKNGWQIVLVGYGRWQVVAAPEGRTVRVMNGIVSDGAGTSLSSIAEGPDASSAMKTAIKKAMKSQKK